MEVIESTNAYCRNLHQRLLESWMRLCTANAGISRGSSSHHTTDVLAHTSCRTLLSHERALFRNWWCADSSIGTERRRIQFSQLMHELKLGKQIRTNLWFHCRSLEIKCSCQTLSATGKSDQKTLTTLCVWRYPAVFAAALLMTAARIDHQLC